MVVHALKEIKLKLLRQKALPLKAIKRKLFRQRGIPKRYMIETTNHCNLNCPFCMVGQQNLLMKEHGNVAHDLMKRKLGKMSEETFQLIKQRLVDIKADHVYLHFQGEPFLNKNTPRYARELYDKGILVTIFTNGQVLTEKILGELKNSFLHLLRFSVDGASEATYQINRVGGTFAKVKANMIMAVKELKDTPTRLEWQFLPLRNNEHEVETAKEMAAEIGINYFMKGYRETDPELSPRNPELRSKFAPKPCTDIYVQGGIYWNGDVVPCCYDNDGAEIMGNIHNNTLQEIWDSPKYKDFRKRVDNAKEHPENEPDICKGCLRWR